MYTPHHSCPTYLLKIYEAIFKLLSSHKQVQQSIVTLLVQQSLVGNNSINHGLEREKLMIV
jgi:hypothetical protein